MIYLTVKENLFTCNYLDTSFRLSLICDCNEDIFLSWLSMLVSSANINAVGLFDKHSRSLIWKRNIGDSRIDPWGHHMLFCSVSLCNVLAPTTPAGFEHGARPPCCSPSQQRNHSARGISLWPSGQLADWYIAVTLFITLRPRQMAAIFQTTFSNAFSWMRMY